MSHTLLNANVRKQSYTLSFFVCTKDGEKQEQQYSQQYFGHDLLFESGYLIVPPKAKKVIRKIKSRKPQQGSKLVADV